MLLRSLLAPLAAVAVAGCVEEDLAILINETGTPLLVRYAVPHFSVNIGAPPICPLRNSPPQVRPSGGDLRSPAGWMPVAGLTVDVEKCEANYVLESGHAALVYRNGFCDDYEQHAGQGAAFRPSLEYLVVESRAAVSEWRQWDAVEQFKRVPAGSCVMRIRESP